MIYDTARWGFLTINYQMMVGDCQSILTPVLTNSSLVYDHQRVRPLIILPPSLSLQIPSTSGFIFEKYNVIKQF